MLGVVQLRYLMIEGPLSEEIIVWNTGSWSWEHTPKEEFDFILKNGYIEKAPVTDPKFPRYRITQKGREYEAASRKPRVVTPATDAHALP